MKDTWRFLSHILEVHVMPEHEIYEVLYSKGMLNILKDMVGRDVEGREMRTQDFSKAPWLCVKPRISLLQHYRLSHPIVGCVLTKFESTKQLVTAIFDALKGTLP